MLELPLWYSRQFCTNIESILSHISNFTLSLLVVPYAITTKGGSIVRKEEKMKVAIKRPFSGAAVG